MRTRTTLPALLIVTYLSASVALASNTGHKKPVDLGPLFTAAAEAARVDVKLLRAICWTESNFRVKVRKVFDQNDLSKRGAPSYGVCQVQMRTALQFGYTGTAYELNRPEHSIAVAAKYLSYLLKRSSGDWHKAATAYNRGWVGAKKARKYNSYVIKVLFAMHEGR